MCATISNKTRRAFTSWGFCKTVGIVLLVILLGLCCFKIKDGYFLMRGHGDVLFQANTFTESTAYLKNPNRGFYYMHGFYITDEKMEFSQEIASRFCEDTETDLTMIQINLAFYKDGEISAQGLANIDALFQSLKTIDKQLIVRFLYDWDGTNELTEPEELAIILRHMEQVGPIVAAYRENIYTLQGLFIGNWGEMNGTVYTAGEDLVALYETLRDATDDSVFLSVRMPMQWRKATGITDPLQGRTKAGKLGLFNDGMLGSFSDYGTYGTSSREEAGDYSCWSREEEIAFQKVLCETVPNGGEVIVDNAYNDFEAAKKDLADMHVSYLNKDFDRNVYRKWADYTVAEEGCYRGMDGLSYMERHLGYRLLITEADAAYSFKEDSLSVSVKLKNVGFAPVLKETKAQLIVVSHETGEYRGYPVLADIKSLVGGTDQTELVLEKKISLMGEKPGQYELYFCLTDTDSGRMIYLANEQPCTEWGYALGTMQLLETGTEGK